jgi:transcription antitermination factor NusG
MNTTKSLPWFALYVKPRHEKNVALILRGKGYEAFLPIYTHRVKNNKSFNLPLFPGYVFCRIELSSRLPVMKTPGIFSIVGNGSEPEPICDHEIEAIRRMIDSGFMPVPWSYVVPGQEVSVESGPLRGVQGVIVEAKSDKWLVVSVNLLRRSIAVKIERDFLSIKMPVASSTKSTKSSLRSTAAYA